MIKITPADAAGTTVPGPPIVGNKVELQLFTTLRCNLRCSYCSESVGDVRGSRGHVDYPMAALDRFIATHLEGLDVYVTFYGGEPTLNIDFMRRVMEAYPGFRYQMQTNGTLLHRLPDEVCAGLSNVLVSVDGGRETTDGYRGRGVYNRVMRNLARVRPRIRGTVTARVTWAHAETTLGELEGLLEHCDYVYFQFAHRDDVYAPAEVERKKRVLTQMIERFFSSPALFPIIPVMGMVRNKLMPELAGAATAGLTQCRVSTNIVNVLPDGSLFPCPDMVWAPQMRQGSLQENTLARSALQPHPEMPCERCEALPWCRRNCMKNLYVAYVQKDDHYRRHVVEPICELVKFMGREIDRHDARGWLARAKPAARREVACSPVYDYVEVMP
jgi:uncharacterized protein